MREITICKHDLLFILIFIFFWYFGILVNVKKKTNDFYKLILMSAHLFISMCTRVWKCSRAMVDFFLFMESAYEHIQAKLYKEIKNYTSIWMWVHTYICTSTHTLIMYNSFSYIVYNNNCLNLNMYEYEWECECMDSVCECV